jgi:hypothetical protein
MRHSGHLPDGTSHSSSELNAVSALLSVGHIVDRLLFVALLPLPYTLDRPLAAHLTFLLIVCPATTLCPHPTCPSPLSLIGPILESLLSLCAHPLCVGFAARTPRSGLPLWDAVFDFFFLSILFFN